MHTGGRRKAESGRRQYARRLLSVFCLASFVLLPACGKKGPPRAPLNLLPQAPVVTARRLGDTVFLQMPVPTRNENGPGAVSIARLEIYAVNVDAGVPPPVNVKKEVLKPAYHVGKIDVRPPVDPDAPPPENEKPDTRPKPGDIAVFVETLTPDKLKPQIFAKPLPKAKKAAPKTPPPTPPAAAAGAATPPAGPPPPALPQVPTRIYFVEGVSANGRPGTPSARVAVPLVAPPPPILGPPTATAAESSVTLTWNPPPSASDEALGVTYNVYAAPSPESDSNAPRPAGAPVPLNPKPIDTLTFEHGGAATGKEQCFTVRSVATVENMTIESDPSQPVCVTPADVYPPAPPKNLAVVAGGEGRMNLIWDANTEPDLAGYIVLRGEAPAGELQPLTAEPIRETRYTDTTAKGGVTYIYAVVAVDKASNKSQPSNKVTETAR